VTGIFGRYGILTALDVWSYAARLLTDSITTAEAQLAVGATFVLPAGIIAIGGDIGIVLEIQTTSGWATDPDYAAGTIPRQKTVVSDGTNWRLRNADGAVPRRYRYGQVVM